MAIISSNRIANGEVIEPKDGGGITARVREHSVCFTEVYVCSTRMMKHEISHKEPFCYFRDLPRYALLFINI